MNIHGLPRLWGDWYNAVLLASVSNEHHWHRLKIVACKEDELTIYIRAI